MKDTGWLAGRLWWTAHRLPALSPTKHQLKYAQFVLFRQTLRQEHVIATATFYLISIKTKANWRWLCQSWNSVIFVDTMNISIPVLYEPLVSFHCSGEPFQGISDLHRRSCEGRNFDWLMQIYCHQKVAKNFSRSVFTEARKQPKSTRELECVRMGCYIQDIIRYI